MVLLAGLQEAMQVMVPYLLRCFTLLITGEDGTPAHKDKVRARSRGRHSSRHAYTCRACVLRLWVPCCCSWRRVSSRSSRGVQPRACFSPNNHQSKQRRRAWAPDVYFVVVVGWMRMMMDDELAAVSGVRPSVTIAPRCACLLLLLLCYCPALPTPARPLKEED